MKKKFTLLITVTALLLAGSSGKVWGQGSGNHNIGALPGSPQAVPDCTNQFGAAESSVLNPPQSQSGTWITLGGENRIIHTTDKAWGSTADGEYWNGGTYTTSPCNKTWSGGTQGNMAWSIPMINSSYCGNTVPGNTVSSGIAGTEYVTPTTLILNATGSHQYTQFLYNEITWGGYEWTGVTDTNGGALFGTKSVSYGGCWYGCGTTDCWSGGGTTTTNLYYRVWSHTRTYKGGYKLDGAIKIIAGANIQLTGNITKGNTTMKHQLVFPNSTSAAFSLRVAGDYGNVETAQENTTTTYYSTVPNNNAGTSNPAYNGTTYSNVVVLNGSSTLGVQRDYNNTDTYFSTNGCASTTNNSTIQIGGSTNNTNRFIITSGGTLKNYGSNHVNISTLTRLPIFVLPASCGTSDCHNAITSISNLLSGVPNATERPLKILNDLDSCIIFSGSTAAPNLTHHLGSAPLWIHASTSTGDVLFQNGFDWNVNTLNNYLQIQAGQDIKTTTDKFEYKGGNTNYNIITGRHIDFSSLSPLTITTYDNCEDLMRANNNITANANVKFEKNGTSTNHMHAVVGNVTVADGMTYTFDQKAASGDVLVRAGTNITMGGVVTVTRAATTAGNIDWTADSGNIWTKEAVTFTNNIASDATRWTAGDSIKTYDNVTYTHSGSGMTRWLATNDIYSIPCGKTISFAHTGTGATYWEATNRSISVRPDVTFTKANPSNGYTEWKAGRNINTYSNVTFTSSLNTTAGATHGTKWQAGNDINVIDLCNPTTIAFTNSSTVDDYMWWYAGQNVKVAGAHNSPIIVNFTNDA